MKPVILSVLVAISGVVVREDHLQAMQTPDSGMATLVLIANRQATTKQQFDCTEVLVMESSGGKILWRFAHGPLPVDQFRGEVPGTQRDLMQTFEEVDRIERRRIRPGTDSIDSPSYFTLVLISDKGVSMCVSLNSDQGHVLMTSEASRRLFQDVRKVVFGRGYLVHDLLFKTDGGAKAVAGPYGKTHNHSANEEKSKSPVLPSKR